MKIKKIQLLHLRNDAHFQFHAYCLNQNLQNYQDLQNYRSVMQGACGEATRPCCVTYNLTQVARAAALCEKRGFSKGGSEPHFEKSMIFYKKKKIVFDTYGNLATQPLNEETSAINNLLQELEGKYANDAEAVGIKQWVAELKKRNNALSEFMENRFDESASKSDIVVKEARAELDKAYRTITEKIDALVIVDGVKNYENFIRTWNAVIDKYAVSLKRNKTSSQPKEVSNEQI